MFASTSLHCVALLALPCAHVLPALRHCRRGIVVIGLSAGGASSMRTYQCLAEKDARVTSRYADAGHYIALHLRMPAKQSTITSMAASDAADGFPPGIEVP